ncbi:MAG: hypothetical protein H6Q90_817 [Deltaproteobacteria bacterium]|nr:hypothetical protein [Deltaproteobacteria bacterium]
MRSALALLTIALTGCGRVGFSEAQLTGDSGNGADADPDAVPCLVTGPCITTEPDSALTIETRVTLDTDLDTRCKIVAQDSGPEVCVVHVKRFTVTETGQLVSRGSRSLVIASDDEITIDGTIDVSSDAGGALGAGASSAPSCTGGAEPVAAVGGGGGGAGGSFAGTGGTGGVGDTDNALCPGGMAAPAFSFSSIHGGCAGQHGAGDLVSPGGPGGASGGALYLVTARSIQIIGTIDASGAGGLSGAGVGGGGDGAGGGGSGGLIVLHGQSITLTSTAIVAANGGGGAEGATQGPGARGADGSATAGMAAGGSGTQVDGGDGGAGGSATMLGGGLATDGRGGGGGGGGGAGVVHVVGTLANTGTISPSPS